MNLLLEKNIEKWTKLCGSEDVIELPSASLGWPKRLEGRAAISNYIPNYPDCIELHEFAEVTFDQTVEPDTIVVEIGVVGRVVTTEGPSGMTCIAVAVIRDGHFVSYRDY